MEAEESRKKTEGLAASSAQKLEESHNALLVCIREAKDALDIVLLKARSKQSDQLPDADPKAFSTWLKLEIGQLGLLLDNVLDFGAYGATLAVARSFQVTGYDHLKNLGAH